MGFVSKNIKYRHLFLNQPADICIKTGLLKYNCEPCLNVKITAGNSRTEKKIEKWLGKVARETILIALTLEF